MKSVEDQNVFNLAHQLALKPYATTKATVFITRPFCRSFAPCHCLDSDSAQSMKTGSSRQTALVRQLLDR
jgi:hypothetical protein